MSLEQFRTKSKLTVERLAHMLGLSKGYTSDLLNGRRSCSLGVALRIQRITGVAPHEISARSDAELSANAPPTVKRSAKSHTQTNVSGKTGHALPSKASGPVKARQMAERPKPKVRPARPNISTG